MQILVTHFIQTNYLNDISAVSNWNTGSVTDMSGLLWRAYSITDAIAINNWDIRSAVATAGDATTPIKNFICCFVVRVLTLTSPSVLALGIQVAPSHQLTPLLQPTQRQLTTL